MTMQWLSMQWRSIRHVGVFSAALFLCFIAGQRTCIADSPITSLVFSLDSQSVIAGSQRGLVVRDWSSFSLVRTKDCELDSIHDISVSPNGNQVLVAGGSPGSQGVVQMRSWPDLELERSWTEHQDVVYKVAWRADGQEWASVSWDGYCKVYGPNAKASHITMTSHSGPVFAATYLLDGSVATAGGDRTIVVWNSGSGQSLKVLRQHTGTVHALASQTLCEGVQECLLASASEDRTVRFWQPSIGRMLRFHRFESTPRSIAWTRDGRFLIVGCDDGSVFRLDPISLTVLFLIKQEASVLNILVGPRDERLGLSEGSELKAIELRR